jgi:type I pantothenate kinase
VAPSAGDALPAVPADELAAIYEPLSQLLRSRAAARQDTDRRPYVVGVTGGVAAGKSTTAQLLKALLSGWASRPSVALATTDGFLYPNTELEARGLASRKGCPASYDVGRLVRFLGEVRSGQPEVTAPVYSHETYDVVPGRAQVFRRPDVLVVEGVNVLDSSCGPPPFVSDLLDFSIYVDADEGDIERWYVERFVSLSEAGRDDPASFYHRFAPMSRDQVGHLARQVWHQVNGPNLHAYVEPTRCRADLILEKGQDHRVRRLRLRRG